MIQYQILQSNIIRIVRQTVRRISNKILVVKELRLSWFLWYFFLRKDSKSHGKWKTTWKLKSNQFPFLESALYITTFFLIKWWYKRHFHESAQSTQQLNSDQNWNLKSTTTAMATRAWPNKRSYEWKNSSACASISWSSFTKQKWEITEICIVCKQKPRRRIIEVSIWNPTLLSYVML